MLTMIKRWGWGGVTPLSASMELDGWKVGKTQAGHYLWEGRKGSIIPLEKVQH